MEKVKIIKKNLTWPIHKQYVQRIVMNIMG